MDKKTYLKKISKNILMCVFGILVSFMLLSSSIYTPLPRTSLFNGDIRLSSNTCGSGSSAVNTSINFGCEHKGNGIIDLTFAIIRFLSDGVGVVVIASIIYAGIQYMLSEGEPQKINQAISRIRSSIIALLVYVFAYAILNYVIPGQLLK